MQGEQSYRTEHMLAWLMAALAIGLGIIGALEGFGIIDVGDSILEGGVAATDDNAASFRDGLLFLIPGVISAFLAFTLHRTEHHVPGIDRPALDRLRDALGRYVILPTPEAADAVTLWIAATHAQPAGQGA